MTTLVPMCSLSGISSGRRIKLPPFLYTGSDVGISPPCQRSQTRGLATNDHGSFVSLKLSTSIHKHPQKSRDADQLLMVTIK